jgi:hypothetical protein
MTNVFSFSLFGNEPKYCKGMIKNVDLIHKYFPNWQIWVYIGNDVPNEIIQILNELKCTLIFTNKHGYETKIYRFFPIDDPSVDVCIVRDADSRVCDRDASCIEDFLNSDKLFHIIRDHPNHHYNVMAGMFGIKKGCLDIKVRDLYDNYSPNLSDRWVDTFFVCDILYPLIRDKSLVHDEYAPDRANVTFRYDTDKNVHFVGNVYDYDKDGNEYPTFTI